MQLVTGHWAIYELSSESCS